MSLVSFPSWGETWDDIVERDGLLYKKFTETPFTGEVEGIRVYVISPSLTLKSFQKGKVEQGKADGFWTIYWENGQLMSKGHYKNNQKDGLWVNYWNNGNLAWKGDYKNNVEVGHWEYRNMDGSPDTVNTGTYKNGVKVSD
ncbi:hypothetical protein N9D07_03380 [Alphaproteobacteria bacterium]|nr:hypothetical protein [Alphaproteobacteria bacterium]